MASFAWACYDFGYINLTQIWLLEVGNGKMLNPSHDATSIYHISICSGPVCHCWASRPALGKYTNTLWSTNTPQIQFVFELNYFFQTMITLDHNLRFHFPRWDLESTDWCRSSCEVANTQIRFGTQIHPKYSLYLNWTIFSNDDNFGSRGGKWTIISKIMKHIPQTGFFAPSILFF